MTQLTNDQGPISASWKIGEVLDRYPRLLGVLLNTSPAFGRLRNPILRRVQGRLATVSQAARIAGLDPATLVESLNREIGFATPSGDAGSDPGPRTSAEPDAQFEDAAVAEDLDVRPLLQHGQEPFSAIMAAASRVPTGCVLRLRSTFEPLPLYDVLGKRGFLPAARQLGPDDWEVLFLKAAPPTEPEDVAVVATAGAWDSPTATLTIDVSELVPPEPMVRVLEALEHLEPGESLLVQHVRRPVYLYARLDELGYTHDTREPAPGRVEILIAKPHGELARH
jgi:uncharacterized protein (DUF2249 family)